LSIMEKFKFSKIIFSCSGIWTQSLKLAKQAL
jgi:hypothetical protein